MLISTKETKFPWSKLLLVELKCCPVLVRLILSSNFQLFQVRLGQVRLGQVILGQVRLGQVRLFQVRLGQVRLGQVRLGQVRLGQVRLGQVRLGQVRLGQVRLVQAMNFIFSKTRPSSCRTNSLLNCRTKSSRTQHLLPVLNLLNGHDHVLLVLMQHSKKINEYTEMLMNLTSQVRQGGFDIKRSC